MTSEQVACPCGGPSLESCCGPYLEGSKKPETAEALMRARYSAHVLEKMPFVFESHDPKTRAQLDEKLATDWAKRSEWLGLEVKRVVKGSADDDEGLVEFVASYREGGEGDVIAHHELATFRKDDGAWYFVDGHAPAGTTFKRVGDKVGRNDPCNCGSGKKYKKCCM